MSSAKVLAPPPPVVAAADEAPPMHASSSGVADACLASISGRRSNTWARTDSAKLSSQSSVELGKSEPADRGAAAAAVPAAPDPAVLRSWQFQATGKVCLAQVLIECKAERIHSGGPLGMQAEAVKHIRRREADDTFYIIDLANVARMFKAWRAAMPRVVPFYAVKCYPEPAILKLLIAMGAGFDCASRGEVAQMLGLGVPPSHIIFAHPCKRAVDIRYAAEHNVQHTTFDTLSELTKISQLAPKAFKLVLRIRADDPGARVPLGLKYGAEVAEAPELLAAAKELGLEVMGVSFHVGSACRHLSTFTGAIESARHIFDQASALGFRMTLLDIGGGFTGHFDAGGNVIFGEIATTINNAIAAHFPPEMGVRVIAEPGRYFAEVAATLLTPVYGQRDRKISDGSVHKDYWLTDGLYGSFNCILYDAQNPEYRIVRSPLLPDLSPAEARREFMSTLWGPTCDSADVIYKDVTLPPIRNGDFLMWVNAGAYTVAGACDFNGLSASNPTKYYVWSDHAVDEPAAAADDVEEGASGAHAAPAPAPVDAA